MTRLKEWFLRRVLTHYLKRVAKMAWRQLNEDEKMEFLKSKEQIGNLLVMGASIVAALGNQAVADWLSSTGTAVAAGNKEVILASLATAVFAGLRFLSRLNRKKEVIAAVKEAAKA